MEAESGTNSATGTLPSLEEAQGWIGFRVDEMGGSSVARVHGIYVDQETGEPAWVIVRVGRFGKMTAIPFRDCAAAAGHLWVAYGRDSVRGAPAIDARAPLTREAELELCAHYGIREGQARAGEISERPEGAVTSQAPAAGS
jgi:hypothetical protein